MVFATDVVLFGVLWVTPPGVFWPSRALFPISIGFVVSTPEKFTMPPARYPAAEKVQV